VSGKAVCRVGHQGKKGAEGVPSLVPYKLDDGIVGSSLPESLLSITVVAGSEPRRELHET